MISIIICSANQSSLEAVNDNIGDTIGVPYEVIVIKNTPRVCGICEAYNKGAEKAIYPFLCFMHEDVLFETMNWGQRVLEHLQDQRTGLIGIAGGDSKSVVPSSWSIPVVTNEINVVQHYRNTTRPAERIMITSKRTTGKRKKVIALDGVWLCTRKDIFDEFQFDARTFPGFHGYDIDYSLQVNSRYDVYVIFDIVIHHFSEGNPDLSWMKSAVALSEKWKKVLPVSVYKLTAEERRFLHWHSLRVYMQHLLRLESKSAIVFKEFISYSFSRHFSIRHFLSMGKYLSLAILKKGLAKHDLRAEK